MNRVRLMLMCSLCMSIFGCDIIEQAAGELEAFDLGIDDSDENGNDIVLTAGDQCDPWADNDVCDIGCAPLTNDSDEGECVAACDGPDDPDCTGDSMCNNLGTDEEPLYVCLRNADCGGLNFYGTCDGSVLSLCGFSGPDLYDCAEDGLACALINDEYGFDCISPGHTGGCGEETLLGRCDGDVLVYCQSAETGAVVRYDCAEDGEVCGVSDDEAFCLVDGTEGCGSTTVEGYCEDGGAVYCDPEQGEIVSNTCGSEQVCALSTEGYRCVDIEMPAEGNVRITGTWQFEKRDLTPAGYSAPRPMPVRYATIQILDESNRYVATGSTGEDGQFSVEIPSDTEPVRLAVLTTVSTDRHALSVRDCPEQADGSDCNLHGAATDPFVPDRDQDLGTLTVTYTSGVAGAFNIFDVFVTGFDFAVENLGRRPPPLTALWRAGSNTYCNTSCCGRSTTWILGTAQDTDEYDDAVLLHEFGHFIEGHFSRSDSPGGFHDGSPTDPRLAWGEGYGTYFGGEVANTSLYLDGSAGGVSRTEINSDYTADLRSSRGMRQLVSEYMTAAILWRASRGHGGNAGLGTEVIFETMANYLRSDSMRDRGVFGVDLVDFLDGLICRGHQAEDFIQNVVIGIHQFPYEAGGPANCR